MRRTPALATALIPCALVLAACGSNSASSSSTSAAATGAGTSAVSTAAADPSQNNANLTQAQLLTRIRTALDSASAVHMKGGSTQSGPSSMSMDLQVNKAGTAQGTVGIGGGSVPLIFIQGTVYMQLTPSLISSLKSSMSSAADEQIASELLAGRWIKETASSSDAQSMSEMMDWTKLTKQWSAASGDTFSYLGTSTVDGRQVAQYKDDSTTDGAKSTGTLSVPLTGPALPIQVVDQGSSGGTVDFTWNQPTTVSAPAASDVVTLPSSAS